MHNNTEETRFKNARVFHTNCINLYQLWQPRPKFNLALFSTPYPSMLGWHVNVDDYVLYWLPEKLEHIILDMDPGGVIIQNVWFPRRKFGNYDTRIFDVTKIYERLGWYLQDVYIWDKKNAPPAGDIKNHDRNEWEFVFVFARAPGYTYHKFRAPYADKTIGKAATGNMRKPDINGQLSGGHDELHPEGAEQGNILRYSPSGDQGRPRVKGRVFPRGLAERLILQYSNEGDLVYDPFCGSGTTLVMAVANGRKAVGCEIDKHAYEIATSWLYNEELVRSRESDDDKKTEDGI